MAKELTTNRLKYWRMAASRRYCDIWHLLRQSVTDAKKETIGDTAVSPKYLQATCTTNNSTRRALLRCALLRADYPKST